MSSRNRFIRGALIPLYFSLEIMGGHLLLALLLMFLRPGVDPGRSAMLVYGVLNLGWILFCARNAYLRMRRLKKEAGWGFSGVSGFFLGLMGPPALLLAVAIPQFQKFQPRTRQSEAKIALAGIYGAEKAYFDAYKKYSAFLADIGYKPERYRSYYATVMISPCGGDSLAALLPMEKNPFAEGREAEVQEYLRKIQRGQPCKSLSEGFEFYAVGIIQKDGELDVWKIDEKKALVNVQDGTVKKKSKWWW